MSVRFYEELRTRRAVLGRQALVLRRCLVAGALCAVFFLLASAPANAVVWWSNFDQNAVGRTNLDGTASDPQFITIPGPIGGAAVPAGLAVDESYVYWSTPALTIGRARPDGSELQPNFIEIGLDNSGLAIDDEHIYWTAGHSIGRARLDGTEVEPRFITVTSTPCGVAVDDQHIYWGDTGALGLGRSDVDGSNVDLAFTPAIGGSCGVAVNATHIFWGSPSGTVGRATLAGTNATSDFIRSGAPCGVAVNASHVFWVSFNGSIGRADLDGSAINPSLIAAHAGCGLALDARAVPTITVQRTADQIVFGQDISFDLAVAGSGPTATGTAQFSVNGETDGLAVALDTTGHAHYSPSFLLGVGDVVRADYGGDSNYAPSGQDISPIIQPAPTSTEVAIEPPIVVTGSPVTATVTVRNALTDVVPFGSVQLEVDGQPLGSSLELNDDGEVEASLIADVTPAEYLVTARYTDDIPPIPFFEPSAGSAVVRVTAPSAVPPPVRSDDRSGAPARQTATVVRKQSLTAMGTALIKRLRARGYAALTEAMRYTAPGPGVLTQRIYARSAASAGASRAKEKMIASGRRAFVASGQRTMRLNLTSTGRRITRRAARLKLRLVTRFAPSTGIAISATQRATITRRRAHAASLSSNGWRLIPKSSRTLAARRDRRGARR